MMGSECGWGLGEGPNFSFVEGLKIEFKGIFKQREQFDAKYC